MSAASSGNTMTTPDVIALLTQLTTSISSLRADAAARDARVDAQLAELRAELRADAAARDARFDADAAARDVREAAMNERLRSLHARVDARLRADLSPSSPSPASVGEATLTQLRAHAAILENPEPVDPAPFATQDDIMRFVGCKRERDLMAAVAPLLREARGFVCEGEAEPWQCARVLANSEGNKWLDALDAPLPPQQWKKPDLFVTWGPFLRCCRATEPGFGGVIAGALAGRALQQDGCVNELYEAKLGTGSLTSTDFGQLVDYHSRLPGPVRSALFNAREFWLFRSFGKEPLQLIKSEWQARGSRALLRSFFADAPEPPLVPLLRFVARALSVGFLHAACAAVTAGGGLARNPGTSSFLGAGGSSRVFAVRRAGDGGALHALKVSAALSRSALAYEFGSLRRAAAAGAPVIDVVEDSLTFFEGGDEGGGGDLYYGGGFLLQHVCERAAICSDAHCVAAFAALRKLHEAGFAHGDARLPNLLARPGADGQQQLLWIDLREAAEGTTLDAAQRADAEALTASVLKLQLAGEEAAEQLRGALELLRGAIEQLPQGGGAAYEVLARAAWVALGE
jgi:hypothetical protein